MRHGNATWNYGSDFARPLSQIGIEEANNAGNVLAEKNIVVAQIISSAAVRAISTAKIVAEKLGYTREIEKNLGLYDKGIRYYKSVIETQDDSINTILLVAHNPAISYFVAELTGTEAIIMNTCEFIIIEFDIDHWEELEIQNGKIVNM